MARLPATAAARAAAAIVAMPGAGCLARLTAGEAR